MNKTISRRGRVIDATEDTPLYACELGRFMGWSRATIYRHIEQGYRFEYGRTTTPRHYRRWMRLHALRQEKLAQLQSAELKERIDRALAGLK